MKKISVQFHATRDELQPLSTYRHTAGARLAYEQGTRILPVAGNAVLHLKSEQSS